MRRRASGSAKALLTIKRAREHDPSADLSDDPATGPGAAFGSRRSATRLLRGRHRRARRRRAAARSRAISSSASGERKAGASHALVAARRPAGEDPAAGLDPGYPGLGAKPGKRARAWPSASLRFVIGRNGADELEGCVPSIATPARRTPAARLLQVLLVLSWTWLLAPPSAAFAADHGSAKWSIEGTTHYSHHLSPRAQFAWGVRNDEAPGPVSLPVLGGLDALFAHRRTASALETLAPPCASVIAARPKTSFRAREPPSAS